jgi:hypothetical protein
VGPSGEIVGIERDPKSIAKARARVTEARLHNVTFNESDVGEIPDGKPFDAVVGRFILMYLPDPVSALLLNFTFSAAGRNVCFPGAILGPGACAFGAATSLVGNGRSH